ncbi:MAG TPA: transporter [Firmicutes bacterium]|nr:transporter [Bacillota bacterium]
MNHFKYEISPTFLCLTCLFVTCLLISNIIAGKLALILGMTLPAAVIVFPITYIFGDVLTEVYGYERTRLVIWIGFAANLLMSLLFMITIILPYPKFWNQQGAYTTVLGLTPRLVAASLIGYFGGEFANSFVLSKVKLLTKGRWLWIRTIGSTVVGEGIDTLLFIVLAFVGSLPMTVLIGMIGAQYIWKVGYEILATPLTYRVVGWVKRRENTDTFDYKADYNPFRLEETHGTI